MVSEEVRVEVPLPVIPEEARIGAERRALDARALQRLFGVAIIKACRIVEKLQRRARNAEIGKQPLNDGAHRRQAHQAVADTFGDKAEHARVDADAELRRTGGACKHVEDLPDAQMLRVRQMERLLVELRLMRDMVERLGDRKSTRLNS